MCRKWWSATREKQKTGSRATGQTGTPRPPQGPSRSLKEAPFLICLWASLSVDPELEGGHAKMFENSLRFSGFGIPSLEDSTRAWRESLVVRGTYCSQRGIWVQFIASIIVDQTAWNSNCRWSKLSSGPMGSGAHTCTFSYTDTHICT